MLQGIDGSFILSGYENNSYPSEWEKFEFVSYCSASGKGKTGEGRDKSKKSIDLGDRKRKEVVLRKITTKKMRPELTKFFKQDQYKLFGERL